MTKQYETVSLTYPLPTRRWIPSGAKTADGKTMWYSEVWTPETREAAARTKRREVRK